MAALTDDHNPFSESDFIKTNPKYPSSLSKTVEMFQMNSNVVSFKLVAIFKTPFLSFIKDAFCLQVCEVLAD